MALSGEKDPGMDGVGGSANGGRTAWRLVRAWSGLTAHEQQAVMVVLVLALLGIGVKLWHSATTGVTAAEPARADSVAPRR